MRCLRHWLCQPCPTVIPRHPTADCPPDSTGPGRCARICTCPSAPHAAATATSTPTCRRTRRLPLRTVRAGGQREIELAADVCVVGPPLASIFIGGGTPSLLPVSHLNELLDALRASFGLEPGAEVTLEANPENVSPESLVGWLEAGVTRLSIGMQSADPDALTVLQQVHARRRGRGGEDGSYRGLRAHLAGSDLRVPGQSLDSWRSTLLSALASEPDHISAYALGWNAAPPWAAGPAWRGSCTGSGLCCCPIRPRRRGADAARTLLVRDLQLGASGRAV